MSKVHTVERHMIPHRAFNDVRALLCWPIMTGPHKSMKLCWLAESKHKQYWSWWRHQMKHFPRNWPFVRGIHRSPVNSPHKGQWRGALMFTLICPNKRLSKHSGGWWFETLSSPLWRHRNDCSDDAYQQIWVRFEGEVWWVCAIYGLSSRYEYNVF